MYDNNAQCCCRLPIGVCSKTMNDCILLIWAAYIWLLTAVSSGLLEPYKSLRITVGNFPSPRLQGSNAFCIGTPSSFNRIEPSITLPCNTVCTGRYVVIARGTSTALTELRFCEVEIYRRTYFIIPIITM